MRGLIIESPAGAVAAILSILSKSFNASSGGHFRRKPLYLFFASRSLKLSEEPACHLQEWIRAKSKIGW
jgi:hypothetical protein